MVSIPLRLRRHSIDTSRRSQERKNPLAPDSAPDSVWTMDTTQISAMSVPEKLQLMDAIWEDLSTSPEQFEPPSWHREELEKTQARRELGLEEPMTLEEARNRLFPHKNDS